ncbi:MAG TPA: serine hydrolase [Thermoanaerobaculia bacterium]|nr:serine hydrolase [Thermoanaerobaculia bacterium]
MKIILALLPLSLLLACAAAGPRPAAKAGPASIGGRLETYYQRPGVKIGVAYRNLGTGAFYFHDEEESFHAASTMKVPVMMALFQAVDGGEMRLADPIPVRNEFQSLVDGSPFALDPKEDGDADLYQAVGGARPLEELIRRMIVRSSNLATNLLIEKIGASRANDLMRSLGAFRIQVLRGVEDEKAFKAGLNNKVTAKDLEIALTALAKGETFTPASNGRMIEILKAQEFNEKIPAYLPKGTPIAHKTGDITGVHHDAAIVFPPGEAPYVLVVLTDGFQDEKEANQVIAEISREVWQARGLRQ